MPKISHLNALKKLVDEKIIQPGCSVGFNWENCKIEQMNSVEMSKSLQHLSCEQLAGLFLFLQFEKISIEGQQCSQNELKVLGFPRDLCSVLMWCAAMSDMWKIKQLVGPLLMAEGRRRKLPKDPTLVSLEFVKSNQYYSRVLEMISPDESRVQMKQPGEITFVPIKHCRWCGLIKAEKFRLCSLCIEFPEYGDANYFCSEKCETEALGSKHREEHARYYEVKLGFEGEIYL